MRLPRSISRFGRAALLLEWEQRIDPQINASVHAYAAALILHDAILECVPAYASLLLKHRGGEATVQRLFNVVFDLRLPDSPSAGDFVTHKLPVTYGGAYGPDLAHVATYCGLPEEEVVLKHTAKEYQVYFLGFQPGFAFLGELDPLISVPRRDGPRSRVDRGAVGLAGKQTGIYPTASPGGWQLIGRCPLPILAANEAESTIMRAGDRVRFYPISEREYSVILKRPSAWSAR